MNYQCPICKQKYQSLDDFTTKGYNSEELICVKCAQNKDEEINKQWIEYNESLLDDEDIDDLYPTEADFQLDRPPTGVRHE